MEQVVAAPAAASGAPPGKKKGPPEDRYERPAVLTGLPKEIILYQYEVCPFCCKAKAVFDYYKARLPWAASDPAGGSRAGRGSGRTCRAKAARSC